MTRVKSTIAKPALTAQMIAYIGLEQGCTRKQLIAIMIAIGIHPDTAAKQYNDIRRTFKSAA